MTNQYPKIYRIELPDGTVALTSEKRMKEIDQILREKILNRVKKK